MNYITMLNAFFSFIQECTISNNAQLLFYTLLAINNQKGWQEWFPRTNASISAMMGVSEKTFINARAELKAHCMIDFVTSKKRGDSTSYKVCSVKCWVQTPVQTTVQSAVQTPALNNKHKTKIKSNTDVLPEKPGFSSDIATICEMYNSICGSYPRLVKVTDGRKKAIAARMNTGYTVDDFKRLFEMAERSDFLRGKNGRNWRATFDWLIKDSNMAKVLEGNYDNQLKPDVNNQKPLNNRTNNFDQRKNDYDSLVFEAIRRKRERQKEQ